MELELVLGVWSGWHDVPKNTVEKAAVSQFGIHVSANLDPHEIGIPDDN